MDEKELQRRADAFARLAQALRDALQEIDSLEFRLYGAIPETRPKTHDDGYNLLVELGEAGPR
jgi:hypothetical protein